MSSKLQILSGRAPLGAAFCYCYTSTHFYGNPPSRTASLATKQRRPTASAPLFSPRNTAVAVASALPAALCRCGNPGRSHDASRHCASPLSTLRLDTLLLLLVPVEAGALLRVVDPQVAAAQRHLANSRVCLHSALEIGEVGVGEAARPASVAVHGHANVGDVLQVAEQAVQVRVRRLVGDVTNVQRRRGLRRRRRAAAGRAGLLPGVPVLNVDAATVPERLVALLEGALGGSLGGEGDETEATGRVLSADRRMQS